MRFSRGKCQALPLRRGNPPHQYWLGLASWKVALHKKDLGVLLDNFSELHSGGMRHRGHKFKEGKCSLDIRRIKSAMAVDRLKQGLRDDV